MREDTLVVGYFFYHRISVNKIEKKGTFYKNEYRKSYEAKWHFNRGLKMRRRFWMGLIN